MRRNFDEVNEYAKSEGLILEKVNRTIDGVTYRYELTSNTLGEEAVCETLDEVVAEIRSFSKRS